MDCLKYCFFGSYGCYGDFLKEEIFILVDIYVCYVIFDDELVLWIFFINDDEFVILCYVCLYVLFDIWWCGWCYEFFILMMMSFLFWR